MAKELKSRKMRMPKRGRPRTTNAAPVGIHAVEVALDILHSVLASEGGISLSSLSRATGLQPNKLHRYVVSLVRYGLLMQMPMTGLYDLGATSRRIGMAALTRFDEIGAIQEEAKRFSADTGATVCHYVWTELGPTLVNVEFGNFTLPVFPRVGSALPLCASATGRVFLAFMPKSATQPVMEREIALADEHGLKVMRGPALERELEKIRSSVVYETNHTIISNAGFCAVGPLFDQQDHLFCTLFAIPPFGFGSIEQRQAFISRFENLIRKLSAEVFGHKGGLHPVTTKSGDRSKRKLVRRRASH